MKRDRQEWVDEIDRELAGLPPSAHYDVRRQLLQHARAAIVCPDRRSYMGIPLTGKLREVRDVS